MLQKDFNHLLQGQLTHWGRVMHTYVSKQTIIGLDNGLSPGWRQAIIWTNVGILSIGTLGTNFNDNYWNSNIFIQENALENIVCNMASILSRLQCVNSLLPDGVLLPSHYLNQCWLIVSWTLGNKFQWNCKSVNILSHENVFENVYCKWRPIYLSSMLTLHSISARYGRCTRMVSTWRRSSGHSTKEDKELMLTVLM